MHGHMSAHAYCIFSSHLLTEPSLEYFQGCIYPDIGCAVTGISTFKWTQQSMSPMDKAQNSINFERYTS
jgi:hypothetical protein